ncbi:MAG TPA: hypothetical protein VEP47_13380 [Reyranella sp.]|nr:hypothetical protein [Reyranella sp.]
MGTGSRQHQDEAFGHDPPKAKLFDVELCGVSAAYPSRIGLLDALHRAMPPRIELET